MNRIEHQVFQLLSRLGDSRRLLVAVSGGLDSMVLLNLLHRLTQRLELDLVVAHVYHGNSEGDFRRRAFDFVKKKSGDLPFVSNVIDVRDDHDIDDLGFQFPQKNDEQTLRVYRRDVLKRLRDLTNSDFIVMGHHQDDLLETRLIRLIRGVGAEGLPSMGVQGRQVLRPLLPYWRDDIRSCFINPQPRRDRGILRRRTPVRRSKIPTEQRRIRVYETASGQLAGTLEYLEDPSNKNNGYFRNWIRNQWLPSLEDYRAGSSRALARSLNHVSRQAFTEARRLQSLLSPEGVDRSGLMALTIVEQRQVLATYMKVHNVKNYSASHIDEILKRLKSSKKLFEFTVASRVWKASANHLQISTEK